MVFIYLYFTRLNEAFLTITDELSAYCCEAHLKMHASLYGASLTNRTGANVIIILSHLNLFR
jgi:hypothetical protein